MPFVSFFDNRWQSSRTAPLGTTTQTFRSTQSVHILTRMILRRRLCYAALLSLVFFPTLVRSHGLPMMVTIPPYDEECYRIRTPNITQTSPDQPKTRRVISGDYEVLDEDFAIDPVLVYLMEDTPEERILWRSRAGERAAPFRMSVPADGKAYWICIQNSSHQPDSTNSETEHPDHYPRTVGFTYTMTSMSKYTKPVPQVFTQDHHDEWMEKSEMVAVDLRSLEHHHEYYRLREAEHRTVVEKTFSAVLFWTLLEAGLVISVAAGQVMYFRAFLEKKTSYY